MTTKPWSRRRLLHTAATGIALRTLHARSQPLLTSSRWVLLGTQDGAGIYRAPWNPATGEIGKPELAAPSPQPTYLALNPHASALYACNEGSGPQATVSAFALDRANATLQPLNVQPTPGDAPCFVSVDATGRLLFAANYGGGSLAAFPLDPHGVPAPASGIFDCASSKRCGPLGPVKDRQDKAHLHCATLSPDNRFVLACDLGDDAILVFPVDPASPRPLGQPVRIPARAGSGPRHLAFHPDHRWLYCIHELDCTADLYLWNSDHAPQAILAPTSVVSLRSPTAPSTPPSTAAELSITRDGRFLYTSTRGADVLTSFTIDPEKGHLTQLQQLPCGGRTPRFFARDPTERWLLCAHQDSESIAVFARDPHSGHLTPAATYSAPSPMCILWL